jgi:regulator of protease activity HflC (stomatin/prohibitin superfamily)
VKLQKISNKETSSDNCHFGIIIFLQKKFKIGGIKMKKVTLIGGSILWTVACVIWSLVFKSSVDYQYGNSVTQYALWAVPSYVYIPSLIGWYFLNWINMVNEWERRPVLLFGKYKGTYGPGLVFIEPLFHSILPDVSVQDIVIEIPAEYIQTKDNVGVSLTGLLTYRINPEKVKDAVVEVEDIDDAIMQRGFSTLTDEVGKQDLDHLLKERDAFCEKIKKIIAERVIKWGPQIQAFELKSFQITDAEIANAIAMKAKAQKEGEAELTRANMQKQIAEALNIAAAAYNEDGKWLKGIETLVELCRSAENNTVIIPSMLTNALANFDLTKKG